MKTKVEHYSQQTVPGTIFSQPWWLEAVAPNSWGEVYIQKKSELLARMPYVIKKKYGKNMLIMPNLTQNLGPYLCPSKAKYTKQLSEQKQLMNELINKLPPFDYFSQNFHYSMTNWLPFYWKGFKQTTFYTYVLEDISDPNLLWKNFRKNISGDIRKAQKKKILVRDDLGIDTFLKVNECTFKRQNRKMPYSTEFVKRLDKACALHKARKIFFSVDKFDQVHSVVYIVWDENSAYYLMGGSDPTLRGGAASLTLYEAIKFASTVTKKFDFEGSMMESVERFFRAFGAKQIPYFNITKNNSYLIQLLHNTKNYFDIYKNSKYF